ncbi:hypothetical protein BDK92_4562 [Micromonospora pisi]|uniref:Uncharacterized protein n=1 Tax=Micromonospora pisi TaxID=589240 RepID=A0A495JP86_9ACTN|nr:hypothetical protein BDK92_4562 [Micromonospora pisi]
MAVQYRTPHTHSIAIGARIARLPPEACFLF